MKPLPPIFRAICDTLASRLLLAEKGWACASWLENGHIYATDGFIVVRIPDGDWDVPPPDSGRRPGVLGLAWSASEYHTKPVAIRTPSPGTVRCTKCSGLGRCTCLECKQERDCPRCKGTGWEDDPPPVPVGDGLGVRASLANLLLAHGVAVVYVAKKAKTARFTFDHGGEGLVILCEAAA